MFFLALIALSTTWLIQQVRGPKDWQEYAFDAQFQSKAKRVDTSDAKAEVTDETTAQPRKSIPMLQSIEHLRTVQDTSWSELGALLVIAALAAGLSWFIGVNRFSMHALYRNRLIRAYLGASRYTRNPNPFMFATARMGARQGG